MATVDPEESGGSSAQDPFWDLVWAQVLETQKKKKEQGEDQQKQQQQQQGKKEQEQKAWKEEQGLEYKEEDVNKIAMLRSILFVNITK